jgi:hypothetical protein
MKEDCRTRQRNVNEKMGWETIGKIGRGWWAVRSFSAAVAGCFGYFCELLGNFQWRAQMMKQTMRPRATTQAAP